MGLINWVKSNPTKVLTGLTIAGVSLASVFSFYAGTKAEKVIEAHRYDWEHTYPDDKETKREIILDAGKEMILPTLPAIFFIVLTIFCTVKNHKLNAAEIASLLTLGSLSSKQLADINTELIESLGEKKAKEIRGRALARRFNEDHPNCNNQFLAIEDCGGDVFCGDAYTNTFWMGSHERLNRSIEDLAYDCVNLTKVSLNDLYLKNGLEYCPIAETIVWTLRDVTYVEDNFGNRIPKLPIETTTFIAKWNNKPCLGLIYSVNCG